MNDQINPDGKKEVTPFFEDFAGKITKFTGSTPAFITAFCLIIVWLITGPIFNFSDTWQLVINTGTTIITFLMVFLIQRSQNKDSLALHLKLNELVASTKGASNRLISAEDLNEEELSVLRNYFELLANRTKKEADLNKTHSIEEAHKKGDLKLGKGETSKDEKKNNGKQDIGKKDNGNKDKRKKESEKK